MGSLHVIEPGMLTTVQDLGRDGVSAQGVPRSGAADPLSLRVGNRLVGNGDNAAALEMTLTGGAFLFDDDAVVALTGGQAVASVESGAQPPRTLAVWAAAKVGAGETLRIGPVERGARVYLCIAGGLEVPTVLGAASTLLGAGFGGFEGRALRAGDRLRFRGSDALPRALSERAVGFVRVEIERRAVRAVAGAHRAEFDSAALAQFWGAAFTVTNRSNRVGLGLDGPRLMLPAGPEAQGRMISEGMTCGTIQVPPDGKPIVLMVDHPTTGGYPAIACVASVDLPALGQLRPGDEVRFEQVSLDEARRLFRERERRLDAEIGPGRSVVFP